MILSGQVSPDGKLFAFTNTGYTHHALHIVDLATEKEIATFPMEQAWSGLAFAPDGKRVFVSSGAGYPLSDIQYFDRWDKEGWKEGRTGYTLYGAVKDKTAVSSLNISADGKLLYAINNSDDTLYILEIHGGRAVGRVKVGRSSAVREAVEGRQDAVRREPRQRQRVDRRCQRPERSDGREHAADRSASQRPRPHRRRAPVRVVRQHQQRDLVRSQDRAAPRSDQHGSWSEGAGRQHAELARAVARRRRRCTWPTPTTIRWRSSTSRSAARASRSASSPRAGIRRSSRPPPDGKRVIVASSKGNGTGPESRQAPDRSDRAGAQLPAPRQPAERPRLVHRHARREEARRTSPSRSTTTRSTATRCSRPPARAARR